LNLNLSEIRLFVGSWDAFNNGYIRGVNINQVGLVQLLSYLIHALLIKFCQQWLEHCYMICDDIVGKLHALVLVVDNADLGSYAALGFNITLNTCRLFLLLRDLIIDLFEFSPSNQVRFARSQSIIETL
jgi:hypothetical protein